MARTLTPTIPAPSRKAVRALASIPAPDADAVAALAGRTVGTGGGYKGPRHDEATLAALSAVLDASGVAIDSPTALTLCFAVCAGAGYLRWVMRPSDSGDGTLAPGKAPLAPVDIDDVPANAAVAVIPACGAFPGGLEIVAPATIPASGKAKAKSGLALYRMRGGTLAPVLILAPDGKAREAVAAIAAASGMSESAAALVAHLAGDNQGGRMLALVRAAAGKGA